MAFGKKVLIYLQENVVLLTGACIIVATHWGWSKLQHVPALVPENQRKELPIIIGAKYLEKKVSEEFHNLTSKVEQPDVTETKQ